MARTKKQKRRSDRYIPPKPYAARESPQDTGSWFLAIIGTLIGGFMLLAILGGELSLYNSRYWVPTSAQVQGLARRYTASKIQPYSAEIAYRYTYKGSSYSGHKLRHLVDDFSPSPDMQKEGSPYAGLAQSMAAGQPITIYVNPADPSNSVAINEVASWWVISFFLLFAQVLLVVGIDNLMRKAGGILEVKYESTNLASIIWWGLTVVNFGLLLICGHWQLLQDLNVGRSSAFVPVVAFGIGMVAFGISMYNFIKSDGRSQPAN